MQHFCLHLADSLHHIFIEAKQSVCIDSVALECMPVCDLIVHLKRDHFFGTWLEI